MSSKHTPGPWKRVHDHPNEQTRASLANIRGSNGQDIASIYLCSIDPEQSANATMIAAAPDLLEALMSVREFIADQYGSLKAQALEGEYVSSPAREVWALVCAAIAKAEGGQ